MTALPAIAYAKSSPNYDDIKLLFTGPFLDYGPEGNFGPELVEDVPRFILTPQKEGPFILDSKTYLPMRLVFQVLGFEVDWKQDNSNIEISKNNDKITINTNQKTAKKGEETIPVPILMINNRYYIPLRDFAKITGDNIHWEGDTRTVVYTIKGSKGILPPVRIINLQHKEVEEPNYCVVDDKVIKKGTRKVHELSYVVKNVSTTTISEDNLLISLVSTWDLEKNKIAINQNGSNVMRCYDAYKKDLKPGESTAKQKDFLEYGDYEILIFGIQSMDPYVDKVRSMPPSPGAAGWE